MKKYLLVVLMVATLLSLTITATAQADERIFAPHFWTRDTCTPYWEFGVPDKDAGKLLDGYLVTDPMISREKGEVERAFFVMKGVNYYVRLSDLVGDPRESRAWEEAIYSYSADNLRAMVTYAARAEGHEEVVDVILGDMKAKGVITEGEMTAKRMPLVRTRVIMEAYTDLVREAAF